MLLLIAMLACQLWSHGSATPTGDHTCTGVVKHPVTVLVNVTEPVTFRSYTWCLRVPPRCSKYTVLLKERVKLHTEMHNKTITVCCNGYVEMDYKCVAACPKDAVCPFMHCNRTNHCYCSPGYTGLHCNQPCERGMWGKDCKKVCDCPAGYTCHHLTGDCFEDESLRKTTPRPTTTTTQPTTIQKEAPTTPEVTTVLTTLETVKTPVFKIPPPPYIPPTKRRPTTTITESLDYYSTTSTTDKYIEKVIERILDRVPSTILAETMNSEVPTVNYTLMTNAITTDEKTTESPSTTKLTSIAISEPSKEAEKQSTIEAITLKKNLQTTGFHDFTVAGILPSSSSKSNLMTPSEIATSMLFTKLTTNKPESEMSFETTEYTNLRDYYNKAFFSLGTPSATAATEREENSQRTDNTADNVTRFNSMSTLQQNKSVALNEVTKIVLSATETTTDHQIEKEFKTSAEPTDVTMLPMTEKKQKKTSSPKGTEYVTITTLTTKKRKFSSGEISKKVKGLRTPSTEASNADLSTKEIIPIRKTTSLKTDHPTTNFEITETSIEIEVETTTPIPTIQTDIRSFLPKTTKSNIMTPAYTSIEKPKKKHHEKHKAHKIKEFNQNVTLVAKEISENLSLKTDAVYPTTVIHQHSDQHQLITDKTTPYQSLQNGRTPEKDQSSPSGKPHKSFGSLQKSRHFKLENLPATEQDSLIESNTISFLQTFQENTDVKEEANEEHEGHNYSMEYNKIKFNNSKTIAAGVISNKGDIAYSPFTTMSLILSVSLTTLAFLSVTLWIYFNRRRVAVLQKPPHIFPEPLIYDLSSIGTIDINEANFFCPTFTNNYAERINRELNEMTYDHPRNSFSEPLYAEIRY